jgi:DNA-binding MarR family transcriptional regulator
MTDRDESGTWTLLTGHGHVLVAVARSPDARVRDLSEAAGLTERATLAILADLEAAGYVTRRRVGRRTTYTIHLDRSFRHRAQEGHRVGPFLELLAELPQEGGDADDEETADGAEDTYDTYDTGDTDEGRLAPQRAPAR